MGVVRLLLLGALVGAATGQVCYPPYQEVGGVCFYINTDTASTWQEARDMCRSLAGDGATSDLAVFPTCDAFTNFAGYLGFNALSNSSFWVGAHTEFADNNWRWLNGAPLATGVPYWAYTEGHDNGEDCAAMDGNINFQIADFNCEEPRFSVCSMPMAREDHARDHGGDSHGDCPSESVEIGDYCYWFSYYKNDWWDAEDYCRSHYSSNAGELFAPTSCDEFTKMAHHLEVAEYDNNYWVGASDVSGNQEWFWVNGQPVPAGPPFWATNSPSNHLNSGTKDYCAVMSTSKRFYLDDMKCSFEHYYICKLHVVK